MLFKMFLRVHNSFRINQKKIVSLILKKLKYKIVLNGDWFLETIILIVSRNEKYYHQLLKVFKNVANLKVHLIDKAY